MNEKDILDKENIIKEASQKYQVKDYFHAYPLYKKIWEELKINDPYIMFKYGNILRNVKKVSIL